MLIILSCMLLTGCYDATEIDDLAYASAIGLDKGTTNELRMTLQIMVPTAIAGGGGSGDSGEQEVRNINCYHYRDSHGVFRLYNDK